MHPGRDQFISNNNYAVKVIQSIIIEFSSHGNENGGGINKLQKIRGRGRITQPPISRLFMNENWACQRKVFFFSPRDIAIKLFFVLFACVKLKCVAGKKGAKNA